MCCRMVKRCTPGNARKLTRAHLRAERHFRKLIHALDRLAELEILDGEGLEHTRLILEHRRARIGLDVAEWTQQFELENCNTIDSKLRSIERRRGD